MFKLYPTIFPHIFWYMCSVHILKIIALSKIHSSNWSPNLDIPNLTSRLLLSTQFILKEEVIISQPQLHLLWQCLLNGHLIFSCFLTVDCHDVVRRYL